MSLFNFVPWENYPEGKESGFNRFVVFFLKLPKNLNDSLSKFLDIVPVKEADNDFCQ